MNKQKIMIDISQTPDHTNLHSQVERIIESLVEAHTLLARSEFPAEKYNPISSILANAKIDLFGVVRGIIYMQDGLDVGQEMYDEKKHEVARLEKIIELKESERIEWANQCISRQARIEQLESKLNGVGG